jgi:site-specific DNA-methyltransferase (adenine-specific)/modification methylase
MIEKIGNATLYLGDCAEILPTFDKVDAVVTDPPYGINAGYGIGRSDRLRNKDNKLDWDNKPFNITPEFLTLANKYVIWGGNYFGLPATRGFLIWDKNNSGRDFADCEMAWTNQDKNARIFVMRPMNMDGGKEHPTQKPVALMEWCINYLDNPNIICDPFMGSGSTGVACANMSKTFIGIEKEQKYFDIACKRIENAYRQEKLFL